MIKQLPMQYRKKPVVIEAMGPLDWDNHLAIQEWCGGYADALNWVIIPTLEGTMRADPGDWIIRGVKGEFYPCKPDIFAETYDRVYAEGKP